MAGFILETFATFKLPEARTQNQELLSPPSTFGDLWEAGVD